MKMKKRGVIEIQMHWIFVIIAGALILSFFIGIVVKQKSISRKELLFDITNDLDLLISGAKSTEGSITEIDIPELEINFNCRDYWIEGQKKSLKNKPVFAHDKIIGSQILFWSVAWKMPFKVDTFLYVSSPQIRYVFVDAPARIYNSIPDKIKKEEVQDVSNLNDKENYKLKFILFNKNPLQLSFPNWLEKYDAVCVSVYEQGRRLEYYKFEKGSWRKQGTSSYLGDSSMLGSFFTDNIEDYNCIMDKALRELNVVSKIYTERTKLLDDSNVCPLFYGDTNLKLFEKIIQETSSEKSFSKGTVNAGSIEAAANSLNAVNRDIEFQSCPVLY